MNPKQYLAFREIADTGKTKVISVDSLSGGYRLAVIRWYPNWRQYTFNPEPSTVWNVGCLQEVESYIQGLMAARLNKADDERHEKMADAVASGASGANDG